ncbi:carboxylesterase family protein [Pseudarthrobacter sp. ATCC 49987]|uniref:carboxylesterase family protein n=1 Tax=Pseudarthrobacter sp. ATCC 49987 TaxID=2698204 RepID=UPI00136FD01D|nr:carboxylesterase family protein [Pseudarthrobacter sp. ATCC 49987]
MTPASDALRSSGYLAGKLGVPATRDAIAGAGVPRLLAAQTELKDELLSDPDPDRWGEAVVASAMPWQPVIDGDIIPGPPIERIAGGAGGQVDVIAGTNIEDWRLWLVASGAIARIADEILTGPVRAYGYQALAAYGLPAERALSAYREHYPTAAPGELLASVQSDWWMRVPAIRLAEAPTAAGAAAGTYMYEFAWPHRAWVPCTPLRCPLSSTQRAPTRHSSVRCWATTRRRNSRAPYTPPGWPSEPPGPRLAEIRARAEGHDAVRHHLPGR